MQTEKTGKSGRAIPRFSSSVRTLVRRIPRLRETLYLITEFGGLLSYRPEEARAKSVRDYESREDPWGYSTSWGVEHLRVVHDILDRFSGASRFSRVLDVGCGEGWVSETLACRSDFLVGVDIAPIALARACNRCRAFPHLCFTDWDLQRDPALGTFDLILLMGVLECFSLAHEFRNAREKIINMLEPGALLLVTTCEQSDAFDKAWWGRWLPRGGQKIAEFLARDSLLEVKDTLLTRTHRFTLYRKIMTG
jgi:2-polyprenyl-3-methyl-5-hydroxy-6-metoxy-1,4-benzoquinol methylase